MNKNFIQWTDEMITFLKSNYDKMTNKQLAQVLGLRITSTRMKLYELGLKRMELEYWTDEQVILLKNNFRLMGDTEIADLFQQTFPKNKKWTCKHIRKKRLYLRLHRTQEEIKTIIKRQLLPGGKRDTIIRNSASLHLNDRYIANSISWRDKELTDELLKHPEIINLKRAELKLRRAMKNVTATN